MKKLFILLFSLLSISSYSQKLSINDIPEGVKKTFEVTHADILNPNWEKAGELFVAKYKGLSGPVELLFEPSGMLKLTKYYMDKKFMPLKIKNYLKSNSNGFKPSKFYYQVMQGQDNYIVEMAQGVKKKLMKFSIDGKFLSEELL